MHALNLGLKVQCHHHLVSRHDESAIRTVCHYSGDGETVRDLRRWYYHKHQRKWKRQQTKLQRPDSDLAS